MFLMLFFRSNKQVLIAAISIALCFSFKISCAQDDTLRILTYNVKFLPRGLLHLKHHPVKRAPLIPQFVLNDKVDILILQEMFDAVARKKLTKGLQATLPHIIGPGKHRPKGYKKGSGVMIMSRYPFAFLEKIKYDDCKGFADCAARKGALLLEVNDGKKTFQVFGTHMQAGGGRELKQKQIEQAATLMRQFRKPGIPQFACGDFNVHVNDTVLFPKLLADFEALSGPLSSEQQFTSDHGLNDMKKRYNPNKRNTVDHILYKGNGIKPKFISREVRVYRHQWHKKHQDLSDHYALLMKVVW